MTQPSFNIVCALRVVKAKKLRFMKPVSPGSMKHSLSLSAMPIEHTIAFLIDIRPFVLYHRTQEAFVHIKRQAVKSSPRNRVMRMDSINATLVLLIVLFYLISHKQK